MWDSHFRLCITLLLLAIPVAIVDFYLLKGKSGGWISLDFSGVLIGAYLIFIILHVAVSTLAVKWFPHHGLLLLHGFSAMAAIILLSAGTWGVFQWKDRRDRVQYEKTKAERAKRMNILILDGWAYSPVIENATEIIISVTVSESGRFSCGVNGWGEGEYGEMYFHDDEVKQRPVQKGEHFLHTLPLQWVRQGAPAKVELTLYLFADSTGSAGTDVVKTFTSHPSTEDDGHFFYGLLPQPVPAADIR